MTDLIDPYSCDDLLAISLPERNLPVTEEYILNKSDVVVQEAGPYDDHFWIHDSAKKYGNYIYFSNNIKGARIDDLTSVRAFHKF